MAEMQTMNKSVSAIEPHKHNKNRYSVFLDGEYAFSLDDETLVKSKLKVGSCLSDEDVRYLTEEAEYASCKEAGMKLMRRPERPADGKMFELTKSSSKNVQYWIKYYKQSKNIA